jgi:hypothetical protein
MRNTRRSRSQAGSFEALDGFDDEDIVKLADIILCINILKVEDRVVIVYNAESICRV